MNDLHSELEHSLHRAGSPGVSFEDLSRRRRIKQRNTRIVAGVVALAVGVAGLAVVARAFYGGERVPADSSTPGATSPEPTAGDGPTFSFTITDSPPAGLFAGTWFDGALYAIGSSHLYRTTDGYEWEVVAGYDAIEGPKTGTLITDGDRLVNVSVEGGPHGLNHGFWLNCAAPGDVIQVNVSDDGESWTSSQIDIGSIAPDGEGCIEVSAEPGAKAVGPHGIFLLFGIERRGGPSSPVGLWSPDGRSWTVADDFWKRNPVEGPGDSVVATAEGFLVHVDASPVELADTSEIWPTVDGSSWEFVERLPNSIDNMDIASWGGEVILGENGAWRSETGALLLPKEATAGLRVHFTEFGAVGLTQMSEQPMGSVEILYAGDGDSWARWPVGHEDLGALAFELVGLGDGFIVLNVWEHGLAVANLP